MLVRGVVSCAFDLLNFYFELDHQIHVVNVALLSFTVCCSIILHVAPPVEVNFTTSCPLQRVEYPHITCKEDGDFTEIQCRGKMCFCVDPATGERLNTKRFPKMERLSFNCSNGKDCHPPDSLILPHQS